MNYQFIQAQWLLGMYPVNDIPEVFAQAMVEGHDGPAILELASFHQPDKRDIRDELFDKALGEIGYESISKHDAVMIILKEWLGEIADGKCPPREGMARIVDQLLHGEGLDEEVKEYVGDSYGIEKLVGNYYGYDDLEERPDEVSCDGKKGQEGIKALGMHIVTLSKEWVSDHRVVPGPNTPKPS